MTESNSIPRLYRAVAAFAASVVAGAGAGATLAHKPLVVRCDPSCGCTAGRDGGRVGPGGQPLQVNSFTGMPLSRSSRSKS